MLILASTSPWRLGMLRDAGIPVEGVAPPFDEYSIGHDHPSTLKAAQLPPGQMGIARGRLAARRAVGLAIARAEAKAHSVATIRPEAWVIGADQVCWMDDQIFEKPKSPEEHLRHLVALRGRKHQLSTAVHLFTPKGPRSFVEHTGIEMRADLSDAELSAYVRSGEGSGCAGGYQVEARGALLMEAIHGDWHNVIGLPLFRLISLLRKEGWISPLAAVDPS
jgi:septum formation protein